MFWGQTLPNKLADMGGGRVGWSISGRPLMGGGGPPVLSVLEGGRVGRGYPDSRQTDSVSRVSETFPT